MYIFNFARYCQIGLVFNVTLSDIRGLLFPQKIWVTAISWVCSLGLEHVQPSVYVTDIY